MDKIEDLSNKQIYWQIFNVLFAQPTCGSIFRLTTTVNMLQWRVKANHYRLNRFIIGKQTIVKLSTIVNIA